MVMRNISVPFHLEQPILLPNGEIRKWSAPIKLMKVFLTVTADHHKLH